MCGIAAIVAFSNEGKKRLARIAQCPALLKHRGPDHQQYVVEENFAFAHARLSIIDLSEQSNQPFTSHDKRFTIIFNGELFNYKELRSILKSEGREFYTEGDVEVLVNLYRTYGKDGLNRINGFFSFVLYDRLQKTFFAARDRFGVKPFYFSADADYFACASELRTLMAITGNKKIDKTALFTYLQLTYVPEKSCMIEGIQKLLPGECIEIREGKIERHNYYSLKLPSSYGGAQNVKDHLLKLLTESVRARMVSDVPVASFLSGGIDSSVITALAAHENKNLQTFSVGFAGDGHFDESRYAEIVAKKYHTKHHTFHFTEKEAEGEIGNFLDSIDEPFADSSAFNVFVLSKQTKRHVKVVLSGDGADELFAGYNKHRAEWMVRNQKLKTAVLKTAKVASGIFPSSRNSSLANKVRQLDRFASGARLSAGDRYWRWASFYDENKSRKLVRLAPNEEQDFATLKDFYIKNVNEDLNSVLLTDMHLVLASDMLVKVDRMSMAHGLEVRNPFLDYRLVEFAFSLSADEKIDSSAQKKILKESCAHLLPNEILNRKKHGFETPVHLWLRTALRKQVEDLLLNKKFIDAQGIFEYEEIKKVTEKALGTNAGDTTAVVWALLIFNHWYKKHIL